MQIICKQDLILRITHYIMTFALLTAGLIALASILGAVFFRHDKHLVGIERFVVPLSVGVFFSLILYELIPETLKMAPTWGGIAIAFGFISFYVFSHKLHRKYHHLEADDCDRKGAAVLLLTGDAVHNFADGLILGGAFMIDPAVGVATALGLAAHEVPQEIVEYGVLLRAGYTRLQAAAYNLLSASSIIVGTLFIMLIAEHAAEYIWILTGIAAGNLLFLAASDLLPRIHGNLRSYGSIWNSTLAITLGFLLTTTLLVWSHDTFGHGHTHDDAHTEHYDDHESHEADDTHSEHDGDHEHEHTHEQDEAHNDEHDQTNDHSDHEHSDSDHLLELSV